MIKTAIRFFNLIFITLLILLVLSFLLPYLFPGDLLTNISGITPEAPEQRKALEEAFQLDKTIFHQFFNYVQNLFAGNWGISAVSQLNLKSEILSTLPATIELVLYALCLSLFLGIPIGIVAGLRHHNPIDFSVVSFSIVGYSFPVFWLALLFITLFSLQLEWLPTAGRIDLLFDVPQITGFIFLDIVLSDIEYKIPALQNAFIHLLLPTFSVSIVTIALFIRFIRRSTMDVMNKDFIVAAKSRGFSRYQILFKHGVKNILIPILPILAIQVSTLITNVMLVETIFSWPGIGKWLIEAIYQRDYPAIRIGMLVVSLLVMVMTISIEFLSRALDPIREKAEHATL